MKRYIMLSISRILVFNFTISLSLQKFITFVYADSQSSIHYPLDYDADKMITHRQQCPLENGHWRCDLITKHAQIHVSMFFLL